MATKLFPLGHIVATPGALEVFAGSDGSCHPMGLLERHQKGDWGKVPAEDAQANRDALRDGERIMSVYPIGNQTVWVITEADRSATTLLTPSEY